jgi:putative SOS response-associated peptidase YedK
MCNLYSLTRSQDEIRRLTGAIRDTTGNLPPLPGIFPDQLAPVVRTARDGGRELTMMRWGFPPPPNLASRPVTNVRNVKSPYWRGWLKPDFRCLVPATSFCEYTDTQPKVPHWFALDGSRPLFAFAGIWRPWTGERKKEQGEHLLFAFLTTEPNDVVRPVHAKAMPVMLTVDDFDAWLTAPAEEALALQRPFPSDRLQVVATGERKDEAA